MSKEQVEATLAELDSILGQLDATLGPVLGKPLSETTKGMEPLESAKLQVSLAYTMETLYFCTSLICIHP